MLTVLDEDVIDMMAEAFEKRILNQEAQSEGLFINKMQKLKVRGIPKGR